ncbi:MAG: hypothetical protein Q7R78_01545 [bacterium]|nr:hypothetical protein [bacterium]
MGNNAGLIPTNITITITSNNPPPAVSATNVTSAPKLAENTNSPAVPTPAPIVASSPSPATAVITPPVQSLIKTQFVTTVVTQFVVFQPTFPVPAKAVADDVAKSTVVSNNPSPTLFTFSPNMHQTVNVNGKDVSAKKKDVEGTGTDVNGTSTIDVTAGGSSSSDNKQILTNEPNVVYIEPKGHVRIVHRTGRKILFGKMNVPKLKQNDYRTEDGTLIWELYNPWDVTAEFHLSWINKPSN